MRSTSVTLFFAVITISAEHALGRKLSMKVVKEPTNYGMNFLNNDQSASQPSLKTRVPPANFSGPSHLQQLMGKCYSKISNDYKYTLCPFSNVTQHEQTLRWNPFSGVLGVWQQWFIENNTFVAMMMLEGDSCGEQFRTTKVLLGCGNKTEIESISEPMTCNYLIQFNTPLVCDRRSLLVYPTLSAELQEEWNLLEGLLVYGDITQKGYDKQLKSIFLKAGFIMSTEQKQAQKILQKEEEKRKKLEEGNFDSLFECQAEYRKAYSQLMELKTTLGSKTQDNTNETMSIATDRRDQPND